jgi:hypothetical protein
MVLWDCGGTRDHGQQKGIQRGGRQNEDEKLS